MEHSKLQLSCGQIPKILVLGNGINRAHGFASWDELIESIRTKDLSDDERESIKSIGTDKLRKQGYISMNEMRNISQLSYGSVYYAIKTGKLKAKNMFRTWYALKTDFESYLEKYKPKALPSRQKNHPHNLTPEEKLYNSIMNI